MVELTEQGYIIRTSSGVMKLGSTPYFGSKCKNQEWDDHFKEIDRQKKADKKGHGVWSHRPFWEGVNLTRKSGNKKTLILSEVK